MDGGTWDSRERASSDGEARDRSGEFPGSTGGPGWSRVSGLELGPFPRAVACARLHARMVLAEWGVPRELIADAELICSELMTNALRATWALAQPRPVTLRLLGNGERLVIEAWDAHPGDPARRSAAEGDEDGRGLAIVAGLAHRWGSRRLGGHRKAVWAELVLPER